MDMIALAVGLIVVLLFAVTGAFALLVLFALGVSALVDAIRCSWAWVLRHCS